MTLIGTLINYLVINKKNNEVLEKRRFIDTISVQRIEWINSVRESFANFNKHVFLYSHVLNRKKFNPTLEFTRDDNFGFAEATYYLNLIELYLNPNEECNIKLIKLQKEAVQNLKDGSISPAKFNINCFEKFTEEIHHQQQIILKAEWWRIKEETETGKQVDDVKMKEIFKETENRILPD